MAGIYFHIPFCKKLCNYCDFYHSVKLQFLPHVIEAMHAELAEGKNFLTDHKIRTIYFGGGTPSLVSPQILQAFIEQATQLFDCSEVTEITAELNPDDVTDEYIEALRHTTINRVSLGVQSLCDEELQFMGRRHSAAQAVEAVRKLQNAGFDNISVDVIFGVEGFGEDILSKTLEGVIAMGVQHISAYHLTIEEGTAFGRQLAKGLMHHVEDSRSEAEFALVHKMLTEAGFDHYEVSNFALPNKRSKHNSSYWTGDEYLGVGPGAHSFAGDMRRWCDQRIEEYIKGVAYGTETLSDRDAYNEYIMTSLRCAEGISLDFIEERFGSQMRAKTEQAAVQFTASGWLEAKSGRLKIPAERFLISDAVISTLFEV